MNPYELLGDDDASVEQLSKKVASIAVKPPPAAAAAPKTNGKFLSLNMLSLAPALVSPFILMALSDPKCALLVAWN